MNVLELDNVSKKYGATTVLEDVNFCVKKGSICGLIGPNGAGKTTLFRILSGLTDASSGSISINGHKDNIKEERKKISFMIEQPYLDYDMTAKENLEMLKYIRNITDTQRFDEILDLVGLQNVGKKRVGKYSLGMKQRLGLAMALVSEPEMIVLDEPVNGLDPMGVVEMRELLKKINKDMKVTIILSSHILSELDQLATDYILINNGRIIEQITADKLHKKGNLESYYIQKIGGYYE